MGLNHLPSGRFPANGAWLAIQVMAHNLARWTARIGLGQQVVTTKTLRRRFFSIAGLMTMKIDTPARPAASLCICPSVGPGKPSSVAPWHGCERLHSQPDCWSATDPPSGQRNVPPTRASSVREGLLLHAALAISPSAATAGRHRRVWVPTSRHPHPHLLEPGLACLPSLAHQPLCQRQRTSLRWIRANARSRYSAPSVSTKPPALRPYRIRSRSRMPGTPWATTLSHTFGRRTGSRPPRAYPP